MKTKSQMVAGMLVVAGIIVNPMIAESADEQKASSTKAASAKAQSVKKSSEVPEKKLPVDNTVFELGQIVVTAASAEKLQSTDIITSVDVLNADKIQNQNVLTSYDLFHRMPGVQVTQFNQVTTTGKFSFRGFNGEGNINGIKLLIDGIPSNSNDGNMPFIDAIFPLDIESIEVLWHQRSSLWPACYRG